MKGSVLPTEYIQALGDKTVVSCHEQILSTVFCFNEDFIHFNRLSGTFQTLNT